MNLGSVVRWYTIWLFCPGIITSSFANSQNWKMTESVTYQTGTFGTGTRTNTLYVPLTVKRYFDKGDLSVTLSYIYQETSPLVTIVEGTPVQIKRKTGPLTVTSNNGIGDLILKGSYYLLEEDRQPFNLSLVGKIKFPTADEGKVLGTGEFDEGFGLEFSKQVQTVWTFFVDFYYTFIGSPPGIPLENRFTFDLGVAKQLRPSLNVSAFYEESTPLLEGNPSPRDLMANLEVKVTKTLRFFIGSTVGLSAGSPDAGVIAGTSLRF